MIKISKTNSKITQDGKTTCITDHVCIRMYGFNISESDATFLRRKYSCNVSNLESGLCISFDCTGKSKCHADDTFDEYVGKRIAGTRCWDKVKSKTNRMFDDILNRTNDSLVAMFRKISKVNYGDVKDIAQ